MNRGISILFRDARNALLKGSAGQSAAGLGSSPLESLLYRGHDSQIRSCFLDMLSVQQNTLSPIKVIHVYLRHRGLSYFLLSTRWVC